VVGSYGAASKIVDLLMLLPVVVAHVNLPQLARTVAQEGYAGVRRFDARFGVLLALAVPLACGVALFADRIVAILYGDGFEASATLLRILMAYYVLSVFDIHTGITLKASGRERDDVRLFSVNPIANVALNVIAIPAFGAIGAALSSTIAAGAALVLRYRHATTSLVRLEWPSLAGAPLVFCAVAALTIPFARARVPDVVAALLYAASCAAFLFWSARHAPRAGSFADGR
jgi:O-antigen/teichoic acid export membrane protein